MDMPLDVPRRKKKTDSVIFIVIALYQCCVVYSTIARADVFSTSHSYNTNNDFKFSTNSPVDIFSYNQFILLVSSMDGSLTALDMRADGKLLWSLKDSDRPLLSSSITNVKVTRNGIFTYLIPSLDGVLFELDGEAVKQIPVTVDSLLSSSMYIADKFFIVGGKEIDIFAINISTGQVAFRCSSAGCQDSAEAEDGGSGDGGQMLIVSRLLQTVRAVDATFGTEKWNFTVGQYNALYFSGAGKEGHVHRNYCRNSNEDNCILSDSNSDTEFAEEDEMLADNELKQSVKIMVPEGQIVGFNPENLSQIVWSHMFGSPIAKAWFLHRGRIEAVDLFDNRFVPILSSVPHQGDQFNNDGLMLYIGTHQKQLYIQRQESHTDTCQHKLPSFEHSPASDLSLVKWRPYLHTAGFRISLLDGSQEPGIRFLSLDASSDDATGTDHSLVIWNHHYPFESGFYLYPVHDGQKHFSLALTRQEKISKLLFPFLESILKLWKELVMFSSLVSIFFYLVNKRFSFINADQVESDDIEMVSSVEPLKPVDRFSSVDERLSSLEFRSRFADEFECLEQLGMGGYGVVFCARNRVDNQKYAVKRIEVPNSDDTLRLKILREVRTLAMLDHVGIVRYFYSWIEDPPSGWQCRQDRQTTAIFRQGGHLSSSTTTTSPDMDKSASVGSSVIFASSYDQKLLLHKESLGVNCVPNSEAGEFSSSSSLNLQYCLDKKKPLLCSSHGGISFRSSSCSSGGQHCKEMEDRGDNAHNDSGFEASKFEMNAFTCNEHPCQMEVVQHKSAGSEDPMPSFSMPSEASDGVMFKEGPHNCQVDTDQVFSYGDGSSDPTGCKIRPCGHVNSVTSSRCGGEVVDVRGDKVKLGGREMVRTIRKGSSPKLYLYIQMQLCCRETLKDWLVSHTTYQDRCTVLDIFRQVVSAVAYVHSKGLIHRDLKPSNILFSLDGMVKVGDFGLVTDINRQTDCCQQSTFSQVPANHTADVGTQLYMSPEQMQKRPYDQKVDIFSLGLIFVELLIPFTTAMERIMTLQNARSLKFPEYLSRQFGEASQLVKQLLAQDPVQRPAAVIVLDHHILQSEILEKLKDCAGTLSVSNVS